MNSEELETTIKKLEARLQTTEDVEAIKKLQRAYCYYLEHAEVEEQMGLFSHSPDVTIEIDDGGQIKGWEALKKFFPFEDHYSTYPGMKKAPPEYLHIHIPLSGIVDLEKDGKTAKGRWYGFLLATMRREGKNRALIGCGIWENEYVKEDGTWKILKIFFNSIFNSPLEDGWVKTPYLVDPRHKAVPKPGPQTHFAPYPYGYILPYRCKIRLLVRKINHYLFIVPYLIPRS